MAGRVLLVAILLTSILYPRRIEGADASIEEKLKAIRQRYAEVQRDLKQCRQVKRDLPGESAEGGNLTGYFQDSSLRKLAAQFYGESGKALEEYYFWDGQLFFVLRTESHYTKPLSGVVKRKTEDRFYFDHGKLIQWLGPAKKPVTLGPEAEERGSELLAQARRFSARIEDRGSRIRHGPEVLRYSRSSIFQPRFRSLSAQSAVNFSASKIFQKKLDTILYDR